MLNFKDNFYSFICSKNVETFTYDCGSLPSIGMMIISGVFWTEHL